MLRSPILHPKEVADQPMRPTTPKLDIEKNVNVAKNDREQGKRN